MKLIRYDIAHEGMLDMESGVPKISIFSGVQPKIFKGRVAAWGDLRAERILKSNLWRRTGVVDAVTGRAVYISKSSKLPRELVRQTGYKIVLDSDKADFIVIPNVKDFDHASYSMLAHVKKNNMLLAFNVYGDDEYDDSQIDVFKDVIASAISVPQEEIDFYYQPKLARREISLVPKIEEYLYLIENWIDKDVGWSKYVEEDNLYIKPGVEINPETLFVWRSCNDEDVLEKSIIQSDWKRYPITLGIFLLAEKRYFVKSSDRSIPFKMIKESIHFESLSESNGLLPNYAIQPDDWNMLQSWIFAIAGIDGDKGYIPIEKFKDMSGFYRNFLLKRVAVSKDIISDPTDLANKLTFLKNN